MSCCFRRVPSDNNLYPQPVSITNKHPLDEQVVRSLKNSMNSVEPTEGVFQKIMEHNTSHETLKAWCKNQHCDESYDFIVDFKAWKNNSTLDGAKKIFNDYIADEAKNPINIQAEHRARLIVALSSNDLKAAQIALQNCFDQVAPELRSNLSLY